MADRNPKYRQEIQQVSCDAHVFGPLYVPCLLESIILSSLDDTTQLEQRFWGSGWCANSSLPLDDVRLWRDCRAIY